jgi:predicted enzyme related to lactoylglutathione lyase
MGTRTQYTPGTFSWVDLSTSDQPAAKAFYSALFGWEAIDNDMGGGAIYSMMQKDGHDVAAIAPQQQEQAAAGVPPAWNNYITVLSVDASAAKAAELGGTVHAPPFDVMEVGRMAVVQDPQGAFFMLWEPKAHIGAGLVNAAGALTWNDLASPDHPASAAFYSGLFGWQVEPFEGMGMPYMTVRTADGHGNGGIRTPGPGEPPFWLAYFGTDDIDASAAKVEELGGKKVAGPYDIGTGKIAVCADPQGAVFALYTGEFAE